MKKNRSGSYEVVALFEGNPAPQTAPFPNESAAVARLVRLSSNPSLLWVKVLRGDEALYSYYKLGQEFANSQIETLYRRPGGNSVITQKMIRDSEALTNLLLSNQLEVHKRIAVGGEPWWESHRERRA